MMKGNTEIRKFEETVIDVFNASDLPIEVKRLVCEVVLNLIRKEADNAIIQENSLPEDIQIIEGVEQEDGSVVANLKED